MKRSEVGLGQRSLLKFKKRYAQVRLVYLSQEFFLIFFKFLLTAKHDLLIPELTEGGRSPTGVSSGKNCSLKSRRFEEK
ncbi:MAG: hypothetical protein ACREOI_16510, partial [bacterium]